MKFGAFIFPTDYSIGPVEVAKACEDMGFESLWFPEHTHIPTSRKSPWGGGAELPEMYWHTLDPFVGLAAAAAATTNLKIGTGICLVIERDPITLAKEVASLDHLSNGRFLFGVGGGWNLEEMENHGTKPSLRWKIMRERMLAMREIWTNDEPEFHGEFVNFDPIWSWPKPKQKPHPPIVVGGQGTRTFERVVEWGDEWMPNRVRGEELGPKIAELQAMAKAAGRDPIPVSFFGVRPDEKSIERLAEAGVTRCIFSLPSAGADVVIPKLEEAKRAAKL